MVRDRVTRTMAKSGLKGLLGCHMASIAVSSCMRRVREVHTPFLSGCCSLHSGILHHWQYQDLNAVLARFQPKRLSRIPVGRLTMPELPTLILNWICGKGIR